MRTNIILAAAFAMAPALTAIPADADIPPPPDPYTGPPSVHIGGLTFEHQRIRHVGPAGAKLRHLLGYDTYVFLTNCDDPKSPNCAEAKKKNAIGGAVTKIDGVVIGDNVQKVIDALATNGKHALTITLGQDVIDQPAKPRTVTVFVKNP
jgi:hypothetical protein